KQTKSFVMSRSLPSRGGSEFIAHFPADVVPFIILPERTVTPAAVIGGVNQPASNEAGKFVGHDQFGLGPLIVLPRGAKKREHRRARAQAIASKAERPLDEYHRQQIPLVARRGPTKPTTHQSLAPAQGSKERG